MKEEQSYRQTDTTTQTQIEPDEWFWKTGVDWYGYHKQENNSTQLKSSDQLKGRERGTLICV